MAFRQEYVEALRLIAAVFDDYEARTGVRPILVGGAVVEYYTAGDIISGDFDIIAGDQQVFADTMKAHDFRQEDRPGHLRRGFYHRQLDIGVELVSGALFDGRTDPERIGVIIVEGRPRVRVPPVEDMIADRLGQFEASERRDDEMLSQARIMRDLAESIDFAYLERRVKEEGSDLSLLTKRIK
ncbi:MAG: hypothetical protein IPK78_04525 [Rhodospirillales bacterium]|nr:hypothetical protein [Rhodospirillales bacterium]